MGIVELKGFGLVTVTSLTVDYCPTIAWHSVIYKAGLIIISIQDLQHPVQIFDLFEAGVKSTVPRSSAYPASDLILIILWRNGESVRAHSVDLLSLSSALLPPSS